MSATRSVRGGRLRLIADDLTGALDTAAEFVPALGPVRVGWGRPREIVAEAVAFDVASREGSAADAAAAVAEAARRLDFGDAEIAFLKLDSLLRGHAAAEIAAAVGACAFPRVIVAPAFPYQNRRTRDGRQQAIVDGEWRATGEDLSVALADLGLSVRLARPGEPPAVGVTLYDAETDADLDRIAELGAALGADARLLWCGCGGLAGALARRDDAAPVPPHDLEWPVLGLFGTDHAVTAEQLARAGDLTVRLPDGGPEQAARLAARLETCGAGFATFDLPRLARAEAARRIADEMARLIGRLDPPGSLVCGGGETLRAVCEALGASALDVVGRIVPGVPRAAIIGGRWHGVDVVSKSGAFGDPDFLSRLAASVVATHGASAPASRIEEPTS